MEGGWWSDMCMSESTLRECIPDDDEGDRPPDPLDAPPRRPRVFNGIGMLIKSGPKCCYLDSTYLVDGRIG